MTEQKEKSCLVCKRDENEVPVVKFDYQGNHLWICPQHIPMLIHDPSKLVGLLPGAENLNPAE